MNKLSPTEKAELARFLDGDIFRKAKEAVLAMAAEIPNATSLAPERGMDYATERGVAQAFSYLTRVAAPELASPAPIMPRQLIRTTPPKS